MLADIASSMEVIVAAQHSSVRGVKLIDGVKQLFKTEALSDNPFDEVATSLCGFQVNKEAQVRPGHRGATNENAEFRQIEGLHERERIDQIVGRDPEGR